MRNMKCFCKFHEKTFQKQYLQRYSPRGVAMICQWHMVLDFQLHQCRSLHLMTHPSSSLYLPCSLSFKQLQYQPPPPSCSLRVPSSYLDLVFPILSVRVCTLDFRAISLQFKTWFFEFPPRNSFKAPPNRHFGMRIFRGKPNSQPLLSTLAH